MPIFEFGFEHTYVILLSTTMFLCMHEIYLLPKAGPIWLIFLVPSWSGGDIWSKNFGR